MLWRSIIFYEEETIETKLKSNNTKTAKRKVDKSKVQKHIGLRQKNVLSL